MRNLNFCTYENKYIFEDTFGIVYWLIRNYNDEIIGIRNEKFKFMHLWEYFCDVFHWFIENYNVIYYNDEIIIHLNDEWENCIFLISFFH